MKDDQCPECFDSNFIQTGCLWRCIAYGLAITDQALRRQRGIRSVPKDIGLRVLKPESLPEIPRARSA